MSTYVLNTQHLYPSDNNASQTMYLGISNPIDVRGYVFNSSSHFRVSDSMMVDSTFIWEQALVIPTICILLIEFMIGIILDII